MILSFLCPITWKRSAVVRIKIQEFHIFQEKSERYVLSIRLSWQLTFVQMESQRLVSQSLVRWISRDNWRIFFSSYFFQHVLISFISISVVILIIGIVIIIVRRETLCNCWLVEKAGIVLDLSNSTSNFLICTKSQDIIITSVKWKWCFFCKTLQL